MERQIRQDGSGGERSGFHTESIDERLQGAAGRTWDCGIVDGTGEVGIGVKVGT